MYSDPGSITRASIAEQILNIAREVEVLASRLSSLLSKDPYPGEELDKFFRQDLALAKNTVDRIVSRVFDYVGSGRLGLLDSKEVVFSILSEYEALVQRIEAAAHRARLAARLEKLPGDPARRASSIASILAEAAGELTSMARHLAGPINSETVRLVEKRASKVTGLERQADEEYRAALDSLIEEAGGFREYVVMRDVVESLEDAVDSANRIARLIKLMVLSAGVAPV